MSLIARIPARLRKLFAYGEQTEEPRSGMANPCVGSEYWDHATPWPEPPETPTDTIEMKLWPVAGINDGARKAAAYLQYSMLDAWSDEYDVAVDVAETPMPSHVSSRQQFKDWTSTLTEQTVEHGNVGIHRGPTSGTGGPRFGFIGVNDYLDDVMWNNGCVKRRMGGEGGFAINAIIHEAYHTVGVSHANEYEWVKNATVTRWGVDHATPMATGYGRDEPVGWFTPELHPDNDQRPDV